MNFHEILSHPISKDPKNNADLIAACDQFLLSATNSDIAKLRVLRVRDMADGIYQEIYTFTNLWNYLKWKQASNRTPYDDLYDFVDTLLHEVV